VSSPILNEFGNIAAAIEMVDDITEERHASEEIRSLTQKLLGAREAERLMLSRELHDSLAQNLTVAKINCDIAISQDLPERTVDDAALRNISSIIQKCITDVRRMAYDLRPPAIKHLGIVATLANYRREFMKLNGVVVDFQASGIPQHLGEEISINAYRLVQEGLSNVMKHAGASRVKIGLVAAADRICLSIEDNGRGFDLKKRQTRINGEKKLGLRGMKERAHLMKGTMKIMSKPGLGTRITITIPMEKKLHGPPKKNRNRR
jgi:signal transduction histidine kinase